MKGSTNQGCIPNTPLTPGLCISYNALPGMLFSACAWLSHTPDISSFNSYSFSRSLTRWYCLWRAYFWGSRSLELLILAPVIVHLPGGFYFLIGNIIVFHTNVLFYETQDWGLFTAVLYALIHLVSLYLMKACQVSGSVWVAGKQNIY